MIWMPSVKAVEEAHLGVVAMFEREEDPVFPAGVKFPNMLESACMRPNTGAGEHEKYKSLFQKAAALFHSLTKNHPFHNGNKRTAVVTLLTVLHRNNRRLNQEINDNALYDFAIDVTADDFPTKGVRAAPDEVVNAIAEWLRLHTTPVMATPPGMKTNDFIQKCTGAGVKHKEVKGGSHCLQNSGGSVTFSKSTRQLDGAIIKQYLRRLKLHEIAGIGFDEFSDGTSGERLQIYRYMATLKRLAKT